MTRPRNLYRPGVPLYPAYHAVGRPVTLFVPGMHAIEAGAVAKVNVGEDGEIIDYDIRVISGATYRGVTLGDLNNPQPNTFTYAP